MPAMSSDNAAIAEARQAVLPPPIIIVGTRPAATALVGAMIGRNPAAFGLPQLNLFMSDTLEEMLKAKPDPRQTHVHGLLRAVAYIYGGEQTINSIAMARRWVLRRLSWPTGQVFNALRKEVAPQRLVEKSAVNCEDAKCLERIRTACPDACYVHVVEHPLTPGAPTAPGERRSLRGGGRRRAGSEGLPGNQLQWLNGQHLIAEATKHVKPEQLAVLRMEDLLADPHTQLSALCARLDLPNDEVAVAEMLHPENSPFAAFGPVGANVGDVIEFLADPTFPPKGLSGGQSSSRQGAERMLPEVAQSAARYGYSAVEAV